MEVSLEGFKSIGRKSTSDFECVSLEKKCCIKPDQFGLGFAAPLASQPVCQSRSELVSGGKV